MRSKVSVLVVLALVACGGKGGGPDGGGGTGSTPTGPSPSGPTIGFGLQVTRSSNVT